MDFKKLLQTIESLSEATTKTKTGLVHTAEPGGYGRKIDQDEEGQPIDLEKPPVVKRGRGRPRKGADSESGLVKDYTVDPKLMSFLGTKMPKGKMPGKPSVTHSLKEYFDLIEANILAEEEQVTIQPAKQDTQVIKQGTKTLGTVSNPTLAATIKSAIGKGDMTLTGNQMGEMIGEEDEVYEKWDTKTKVSPEEKGKYAGKTKSELLKAYNALKEKGPHKKGSPEFGRMRELAFAIRAKSGWGKVAEADIPSDQVDMGAGLGTGRSAKVLENKMKMRESSQKHSAARLLGRAHALAKEGYNCKYDSMEESRMYHEGYKEGLDECYGRGVYETEMPSTVMGMANQAEDLDEMNMYEMDKTEWMKHKARTTPGDTFNAFGQTMHDKDVLETSMFESLDKQLLDLLGESNAVKEGLTVSISKGHQGSPNSVSVSAQDNDAEDLLGFIKQSGLGLFGDAEGHNQYDAGHSELSHKHGDIAVIDDHDNMLSMMKKIGNIVSHGHSQDYEEEDGVCEQCHEAHCKCDENQLIGEVESYDQEEMEVSENIENLDEVDWKGLGRKAIAGATLAGAAMGALGGGQAAHAADTDPMFDADNIRVAAQYRWQPKNYRNSDVYQKIYQQHKNLDKAESEYQSTMLQKAHDLSQEHPDWYQKIKSQYKNQEEGDAQWLKLVAKSNSWENGSPEYNAAQAAKDKVSGSGGATYGTQGTGTFDTIKNFAGGLGDMAKGAASNVLNKFGINEESENIENLDEVDWKGLGRKAIAGATLAGATMGALGGGHAAHAADVDPGSNANLAQQEYTMQGNWMPKNYKSSDVYQKLLQQYKNPQMADMKYQDYVMDMAQKIKQDDPASFKNMQIKYKNQGEAEAQWLKRVAEYVNWLGNSSAPTQTPAKLDQAGGSGGATSGTQGTGTFDTIKNFAGGLGDIAKGAASSVLNKFGVNEDNLPDSGAEETTADEDAEAAEDMALARIKKLAEWANDAGQSPEEFNEETFTTENEFMLNTITSGLNKKKSTGQTTVPVIAGQKDRTGVNESLNDLMRLAGLS